MKVAINSCHGGFSLSPEARLWLFERGWKAEEYAIKVEDYWEDGSEEYSAFTKTKALKKWRDYLKDGKRSLFLTVFSPDEKYVLSDRMGGSTEARKDPLLVECIETLGDKANGVHADLKIVEIPDDIKFSIEEYDGDEWVAEEHRTWS